MVRSKIFSGALVLLALGLLLGPVTTAQAITLTPSLVDIQLRRGDSVSRELTIRNDESIPIRVTLESAHADFTPEGGINLQGTEKSPPAALPWWLSYDTGPYTLQPGQTEVIPITISVPDNADPGGHYGAVVFATLPGTPQKGPTNIALTAKVAALVLANVEGEVTQALSLEDFTTNRTWYTAPDVTFHVFTNNVGTTHLQPHGVITIANSLTKKTVGDVLVNEDSAYLFPETSKTFASTWKASSPLHVGRYTATLNLTAGQAAPVSATMSFWILPPAALGGILLLLALIGGALAGLKMYRRRLIRRYDATQPKP